MARDLGRIRKTQRHAGFGSELWPSSPTAPSCSQELCKTSQVPLGPTRLAGLWVQASKQDKVHSGDSGVATEVCQPGCPSGKDLLPSANRLLLLGGWGGGCLTKTMTHPNTDHRKGSNPAHGTHPPRTLTAVHACAVGSAMPASPCGHSLCPVLLPLPALHRCPSLTNVLLTKLQLSACLQRALSATEGESLQ